MRGGATAVMEKGGGKLIPIRTVEQQQKGSTDINGWLPAVVRRGSRYSAKIHRPAQLSEDTEV